MAPVYKIAVIQLYPKVRPSCHLWFWLLPWISSLVVSLVASFKMGCSFVNTALDEVYQTARGRSGVASPSLWV